MRKNIIAIILILAIIIIVGVHFIHLHRLSEKTVLSQYQEQEIFHARQLADKIHFFLEARSRGLRALSSIISSQVGGEKEKDEEIYAFLQRPERVYVKSLFFHNQTGELVLGSPGSRFPMEARKILAWASLPENRDKAHISVLIPKVFPQDSAPPLDLLLSIPVYESPAAPTSSPGKGKFLGFFSAVIDLKKFLSEGISPEKALHEKDQFWVIDQDGMLIFHSAHQMMKLRNIYRMDQRCQSCHGQMHHAEEILKKKKGFLDYQVGDHPKKLASFYPMELENVSWLVVVNSPYDKVAAFARRSLRGHLILLGALILVFVFSTSMIIRNARLRVKAEEEARHWREKRELENKVLQSEELYRTVVETAHDLIWMTDAAGLFTYINRSTEDISGYRSSELLGKSMEVLVHPNELARAKEFFEKVLRGEAQNGEFRILSSGGEEIILAVSSVPIYGNGGVSGAATFCHDITDRKKAEKALGESEELHRLILGSISDAVFITDDAGVFTYICPNVEVIFGYTYEEAKALGNISHLLGENFYDRDQLVSLGEIRNVEREISNKNGRRHSLLVNVKSISIKQGTVLYTCRDVTDRKQAEDRLKESEEKYRELVEMMNEGLVMADENDRWTYVNERFCRMLGFTREEIIGRPVARFFEGPSLKIYQEQMDRRRHSEDRPYEIQFTRKYGKKVSALVSPRGLFDDRGRFRGSFAVITDITDRKRDEEALQESEKQLRALSAQLMIAQEAERRRISRELHDELGQALNVIRMRVSFVKKKLEDSQAELREECESTVEYIGATIESVRRLSWDLSPSILEDVGLLAALRRLAEHFSKNHHIPVSLELEEPGLSFRDEEQILIYRVIQEAINNVGKHAGATEVSISVKKSEGFLSFRVKDNGKGFDLEQVLRMGAGKMGIGMASMRERAIMLGGGIEIWSQEGKGTSITLVIPSPKGGKSE